MILFALSFLSFTISSFLSLPENLPKYLHDQPLHRLISHSQISLKLVKRAWLLCCYLILTFKEIFVWIQVDCGNPTEGFIRPFLKFEFFRYFEMCRISVCESRCENQQAESLWRRSCLSAAIARFLLLNFDNRRKTFRARSQYIRT